MITINTDLKYSARTVIDFICRDWERILQESEP